MVMFHSYVTNYQAGYFWPWNLSAVDLYHQELENQRDYNQILLQAYQPFSQLATCCLRGCPSLFNVTSDSELQMKLMSVTWRVSLVSVLKRAKSRMISHLSQLFVVPPMKIRHDSGTDLLEVPTIYKAYVREYPHKIWSYMVQYLHFRILKFQLTHCYK